MNHVEETENVKWCVFKVPQYISSSSIVSCFLRYGVGVHTQRKAKCINIDLDVPPSALPPTSFKKDNVNNKDLSLCLSVELVVLGVRTVARSSKKNVHFLTYSGINPLRRSCGISEQRKLRRVCA